MKTKEELEQIKEEYAEINKKLAELNVEELGHVTGGLNLTTHQIYKNDTCRGGIQV